MTGHYCPVMAVSKKVLIFIIAITSFNAIFVGCLNEEVNESNVKAQNNFTITPFLGKLILRKVCKNVWKVRV